MKKILASLLIIAAVGCSQAKNSDKKIEINVINADSAEMEQAYKKQVDNNYVTKEEGQPQPSIENLPPFKLLTVDNKVVTQNDLKKNKPVLIIYFSPDCSHCTKFMHDLEPEFNDLKDVQIVMATWIRVEALKPFCDTFKLQKYPNFIVGTEGNYTYLLQQYFQVKETPYIAVYNHSGKLVKAYPKAPTVAELMSSIKKA